MVSYMIKSHVTQSRGGLGLKIGPSIEIFDDLLLVISSHFDNFLCKNTKNIPFTFLGISSNFDNFLCKIPKNFQ